MDDVPSEGRLVRLDPAAAPPPPDQIGGALTVEAARYNVYRSILAADLQLTPSAIGARTPIASVDTETWTDAAEGPAPGQAFFNLRG